ncbi:BREX-3 system P-loop-containing protein BrxF [Bacillus inaquosorum]|uniref:BREX-3 system P-loop-containing protein BrxF n=1 Tax=Bacillus inaquosorum TaxID=483913 RepID=UPI00227E32A1|nr:BREX-3 system P-loop-containing protein BrxF [Bacillus inaquosorum]MCY8752954.1 BREX-3 system P-loop-containing protein BrxF [Bacillus inaquosorum]MEC0679669.1 BREX-3 system P-loop-containing protein BrxF [Bacillus inaquosorum]MEC3623254.1 BREX-3 system P-loop-containing protein BrxF [Bacillus inaquosorum]
MNTHFLEQIENSISVVSERYFKQIFVYDYINGNSVKQFAETHSLPYINVNIEISRLLQDISVSRRSFRITEVFQQLIDKHHDDVICLDYYELLFDNSLEIDPMILIKNNSRYKTLIISWRGKIIGDTLIHAEPGHPEYKKFIVQDAIIIK